MITSEALKIATDSFNQAGIETAILDAEILLEFVTGKNRAYFIAHPGEKLPSVIERKFFNLVEQREKRIPIAYVMGEKWFFGRKFCVNSSVLIPRPETEILIELIMKNYQAWIEANQASESENINSEQHERFKIADVGTGSGAIGITLALELPKSKIIATDISEKALAIAKRNAKKLGAENIAFAKRNLLSHFPEKVNIIIANLPYVRSDTLPTVQPEVRFEPREALDGGKDGLDSIKLLLADASKYLFPGGIIFLEADHGQMSTIQKMAQEYLPGCTTIVHPDLQKLDRVIEIRVAGTS